MSDKFKSFDQIYEPDIRHSFFSIYDSGEWRKITLEDLYKEISEFVLNPDVPEKIQINFDIAKNLMLYSWFVYRFMTAAELQAYGSLEMALRIKLGYDNYKKQKCISYLLKEAVNKYIINDKQIKKYQRIEENRKVFIQSQKNIFEVMVRPMPENFTSSSIDPQSYCKILCDTFPKLRNSLAHGNNSLDSNCSFLTLEICCDLINQLFPKL